MAKIIDIEYNDHEYKFITIWVEENEQCAYIPFDFPGKTDISFYPVDKDGHVHQIQICRNSFQSWNAYEPRKYGNSWLLGNGSGAGMGWTYGLTKEIAMNAARAFCTIIENNSMIAQISFENVKSNWDIYGSDKRDKLLKEII